MCFERAIQLFHTLYYFPTSKEIPSLQMHIVTIKLLLFTFTKFFTHIIVGFNGSIEPINWKRMPDFKSIYMIIMGNTYIHGTLATIIPIKQVVNTESNRYCDSMGWQTKLQLDLQIEDTDWHESVYFLIKYLNSSWQVIVQFSESHKLTIMQIQSCLIEE